MKDETIKFNIKTIKNMLYVYNYHYIKYLDLDGRLGI